jgi:hypothetical protein
VNDPPGEEPLEEPPEVAEVDSFAEVTELKVEFSATRAKFWLKGPGTPDHFAHLIFPFVLSRATRAKFWLKGRPGTPAHFAHLVSPFVLSLFGLVAGAALLLADRSNWPLAGAVAAISEVVALVWWEITRRQEGSD